MKGIKSYQKPLMVVEKFTPNEFVAGCWYVKADDIFTELYYDNKFPYEIYDDGEQLNTPNNGRIPSSGNIHAANPTNLAQGNSYSYYSSKEYRWLIVGFYRYNYEQTEVYSYTENGITYYFKDYKDLGGNHS